MEVPVKQSGNEKSIGTAIFDFSNNPDFARVLGGGKPKKGTNKKKMKVSQARPILEVSLVLVLLCTVGCNPSSSCASPVFC